MLTQRHASREKILGNLVQYAVAWLFRKSHEDLLCESNRLG